MRPFGRSLEPCLERPAVLRFAHTGKLSWLITVLDYRCVGIAGANQSKGVQKYKDITAWKHS